ncbi:MAG: site-specific DNA-methyltransferase [Phycisphaerae bacterium]|nr:site-specific DNA-methyltransferase [Phycisphaerae bacterium]
MSTKAFNKLKTKLAELFQLDQADLDFGIYRIMNARRDEINQFLESDLLPQVREAFGEYKSSDKAEIQKELDKVVEGVKIAGMDPEQAPKVKELRARLAEEAVDVTALENEVYDHLYSFFSRYYDEGDFISLRRYKKGVYAIPYEGEEVKLHWANHDQYYIKTTEHFRDYAFKTPSGHRVHFKIAEADTEKDNIKAANGNDRRFLLHGDKPVIEENGELVIRFEYRPDSEKRRQDAINADTAKRVIADLNDEKLVDWQHRLSAKWKRAGGKETDKTILDKHLFDYTRRNTFDYFIHKDLGGFLWCELDFYIKNEVMRLDDIEEESAPRVEQYLSKIKVIRRIAHKIIDFLAQIENFQKKLWLKKKFVVETNYCMTLDRVPEELYPEIATNEAQREEWVRLFAIDEIKGDLHIPAFVEPLTVEFLKANPFLMLDTKFFGEELKYKLLSKFEDADENTDGILVCSENLQALNLCHPRYRKEVGCVYIDPPYNTEEDRQEGKFIYKDSFEQSSWACLMKDRIVLAYNMLKDEGVFFSSIDHHEIAVLKMIFELVFTRKNFEGLITWRRRHNQPNDKTKMIGMVSEYLLAYARHSRELKKAGVGKLDLTGSFSNPDNDPRGDWASKPWKVGSDQSGTRYKIISPMGKVLDEAWMGDENTYKLLLADNRIIFPRKGEGYPRKKYFKTEREEEGQCATNWWGHEYFGHNAGANNTLTTLFGVKNRFSNPKPVELVRGVIQVAGRKVALILDYFAGSGTTGHAVINLNREDDGKRKYILVEMGDHFDTVLKPRIEKVVYSKDWKNGKPVSREGVSHMFKYIRLESYEDALANIELQRTGSQQLLLDKAEGFRESYMLKYMLDVESRGSQTLLNIENFDDPWNYKLLVGAGSVGETKPVNVDLVETFNWLLGLKVKHIDRISGFQVVEGENPKGEKVLVIWRKIRDLDEGDPSKIAVAREKANHDLEAFFRKQQYNTLDSEFDVIYVNGDNNLMNVPLDPDKEGVEPRYKVRLIEEEFKQLMFDVKDV